MRMLKQRITTINVEFRQVTEGFKTRERSNITSIKKKWSQRLERLQNLIAKSTNIYQKFERNFKLFQELTHTRFDKGWAKFQKTEDELKNRHGK